MANCECHNQMVHPWKIDVELTYPNGILRDLRRLARPANSVIHEAIERPCIWPVVGAHFWCYHSGETWKKTTKKLQKNSFGLIIASGWVVDTLIFCHFGGDTLAKLAKIKKFSCRVSKGGRFFLFVMGSTILLYPVKLDTHPPRFGWENYRTAKKDQG